MNRTVLFYRSFVGFVLILLCFVPFSLGAQSMSLILTSDQQLNDLMDPDKKIDASLGFNPYIVSLREVCESGKQRGCKELIVAFDEFFRQYRKDTGSERSLTPDMDEYVDKIRVISDFAKKYDMGICLSLLSPLELGQAYKRQTGHAGRWLAYKVGFRDPMTGKFEVPIWQQLAWTNNKGKSAVELQGVKVYAFKERVIGDSPFRAVNRDDIVPIERIECTPSSDTLYVGADGVVRAWDRSGAEPAGTPVRNLQISGEGAPVGYDRVLVLLEYETNEMDYFHEDAPVFLHELMDKYHEKGVNLTSLYSDEMHIQQDWNYFGHHEGGQFAVRYLTPSMSEAYQKKFGRPLEDKDMLYFVYGAPYFEPSAKAVVNVQYVMGETPEDIYRTFLLRDRYYRLLNDGVVDLFREAKEYAENLFGHELRTAAHASWAESPTIDLWNTEKLHDMAYQYEYTPNFIWGNTVHQAAAACYDYFKWSEYLQPTGNDFAECGWNDRNYYGAAMAASIGVINKYPNAYAAAWGMPDPVYEWKMAINSAFGAQASAPIDLITGHVHRDIDVLVLYPMNLVAAEPRFGSWMAQYGYANYLTADKLLEMGKVLPDGRIQVADKTYGTVVAMFEPLPEKGLLEKMRQFVENGGKVVWFSAPPLVDATGERCDRQWQELFGVEYPHDVYMGEIAAGKKVSFCGSFASIPEQTILSDFLVDRIYPVRNVSSDCEVVAQVDGMTVGTIRKVGKGMVGYFGFRPRDDQSASLGYETRTLFEILNASGAYPASGKFEGVNDNPSVVSRTTDYFVTSFPNTTTVVVKHYRTHRENWTGGFSRNQEEDARALAANPLPSDRIVLEDAKINGHTVSYEGKMSVAFRTDGEDRLIGFVGRDCKGIEIDNKVYTFAEQPVAQITFAPESEGSSNYRVQIYGTGQVTLPIARTEKVKVRMGKKTIPSRCEQGAVLLQVDAALSGQWLTVEQ